MPLRALDRVTKRYWRGAHELRALDDVSLSLEAGDFVSVDGRRGAGKSTLVRIAAGLEAPDQGVVRFQGRPMAGLRRGELAQLLRESIGVIRRRGPSITSLRALDYVALPLLGSLGRLEAHRRAAGALGHVGATECGDMPWHALSDGDQALVSIAHAIVRTPALIVADDPSAGLDSVEREGVIALLRETADESGIAVLMTTPDLPDMLQSHLVMSLIRGRLIQPRRGRGRVIDLRSKRPS